MRKIRIVMLLLWITSGILSSVHIWTKDLDLEVIDACVILPLASIAGFAFVPIAIVCELNEKYDFGKTVLIKKRDK